MTREQMLAALHPPRIPIDMATPGWQEIIALAGLGMLTAVGCFVIMRPFLRRHASRASRIRATRGLPPQERLLAIARITGYLPDRLRPAAYGKEPAPTDDQIERIIRKSRRPA